MPNEAATLQARPCTTSAVHCSQVAKELSGMMQGQQQQKSMAALQGTSFAGCGSSTGKTCMVHSPQTVRAALPVPEVSPARAGWHASQGVHHKQGHNQLPQGTCEQQQYHNSVSNVRHPMHCTACCPTLHRAKRDRQAAQTLQQQCGHLLDS